MILLAVMFGNMVCCQLAILRCMYGIRGSSALRGELHATRRILTIATLPQSQEGDDSKPQRTRLRARRRVARATGGRVPNARMNRVDEPSEKERHEASTRVGVRL